MTITVVILDLHLARVENWYKRRTLVRSGQVRLSAETNCLSAPAESLIISPR